MGKIYPDAPTASIISVDLFESQGEDRPVNKGKGKGKGKGTCQQGICLDIYIAILKR